MDINGLIISEASIGEEKYMSIGIDSVETLLKIIKDVKEKIDDGYIIGFDIDERKYKDTIPDNIKNRDTVKINVHPIIYLLKEGVDLSKIYKLALEGVSLSRRRILFEEMDFAKRFLEELKDRGVNFNHIDIIYSKDELSDEGFKMFLEDYSEISSLNGITVFVGNNYIENGVCVSEDIEFIEGVLDKRLVNGVEINNFNYDTEFVKRLLNCLSGIKNGKLSINLPYYGTDSEIFDNCSMEEVNEVFNIINQISDTAIRKSKDRNAIESVQKYNKGNNSEFVENLIKISSIYGYIVNNFAYDKLSRCYNHLMESDMNVLLDSMLELSFSDKKTLIKAMFGSETVKEQVRDELEKRSKKSKSALCILPPNRANCNGTAIAMFMCLKHVGINAEIISSKVGKSGSAHAYVIAEVEKGKWIKLDPTWDFGEKRWKWFAFGKSNSPYHTPKEGDYSEYIGENGEFVEIPRGMIKALQRINNPNNKSMNIYSNYVKE